MHFTLDQQEYVILGHLVYHDMAILIPLLTIEMSEFVDVITTEEGGSKVQETS